MDNGWDSCNSCKRLGISRLHELHESKYSSVSGERFCGGRLSRKTPMLCGTAAVSSTRAKYWSIQQGDDDAALLDLLGSLRADAIEPASPRLY